MAIGHQASVEQEIKRREAVYREVLTRQQTVRSLLVAAASCASEVVVKTSTSIFRDV